MLTRFARETARQPRQTPPASMTLVVPRTRVALRLALALMASGSVFAHSLAYQIVSPSAAERARVLRESGHGYLAFAPTFLVLSLTVVLFAAAGAATLSARGRPRLDPPSWFFALLPPLGFAVQEHVERLLHDGTLPFSAALEPTFLVGLLLQLPFALFALLIARALLRVAHAVGRVLAPRRGMDRLRPSAPPAPPASPALPGISVLALRRAERAPPRLRLS
jgi:hypothetical protein